MPNKYEELVHRFLSAQPIHQIAARMLLLALQEDVIEPLADAYYAGVTEKQGAMILQVLGEIGGYEALAILRDVFNHEQIIPLKLAAAEGLIRNADSLSLDEKLAIKDFLESLV